jgi:small-conductance mechanosensitive channel
VIGFAAAGIAVALQDVILSVAAYFRVSGRYGIKVGDRVELQGIAGEVVDVSLTKIAMMELRDGGSEHDPTGRLVVIPNSSVFRDKFATHAPGTTIMWDEIKLTMAPDCDYRLAEKRLVEVVEDVFARYRENAKRQYYEMERRLNIRLDSPKPQSRLRVSAAGVEITVRYPVDIRNRAQVGDEIARRLIDAFERETKLRLVAQTPPNIQAVHESAPAESDGHSGNSTEKSAIAKAEGQSSHATAPAKS